MKISDRWKFGVWALLIGSLTIVGVILILSWFWPDANSRAAALSAVVGAIGTLVGAYFGLQAGGMEANAQKDAANAAQETAVHERNRADEAERHKTAALQTVAALMGSPGDAAAMNWLKEQFKQP